MAVEADIDVVADIEAQSFPEAEAATRERFADRLAHFSDCFLILTKEGRPIGIINGMATDQTTITDDLFADASLHNPRGRYQSVFGLAVIPSERRQGCAATLMKAFIEKARQEGREGLILTCKDKLIRYYERFGFVSKGVSKSVHGGAVWYDMILRFSDQKKDDEEE